MKIAVISDIHSNHVALRACIEDMKKIGVDGVIGLGDYVSDCPRPKETLHLLEQIQQEYPTWMIRGNREEYFIDYADGKIEDWSYSSYTGSLLYTYEHLNGNYIDWFRSLENTMVVQIPGTKPLTLAHGSPTSCRELLDAEHENTKFCLEELPTEYILAGHTHRQCVYEYAGKILINPGSIGVAIGVQRAANYVILEWKEKRWEPILKQVPYDFEELSRCFEESNLMDKGKVWPLAILHSINTGINYGPLCAKRAYDLAVEAGEEIKGRIVKEKYWMQAAREYGVL